MKIVTSKGYKPLTDLQIDEPMTGRGRNPQRSWFQPENDGTNVFSITLKPYSPGYSGLNKIALK